MDFHFRTVAFVRKDWLHFLLAAPPRLWLSQKSLRGNEHREQSVKDTHNLFAQIFHDLATKELDYCAHTHKVIVLHKHHYSAISHYCFFLHIHKQVLILVFENT